MSSNRIWPLSLMEARASSSRILIKLSWTYISGDRSASMLMREEARSDALAPACTKDGHCVEVAANIGDVDSVESALAYGAEVSGYCAPSFSSLAEQRGQMRKNSTLRTGLLHRRWAHAPWSFGRLTPVVTSRFRFLTSVRKPIPFWVCGPSAFPSRNQRC